MATTATPAAPALDPVLEAEIEDALVARYAGEAEIRVFDEGRPTDVIDTSSLTADGADLVGPIDGAAPHPLSTTEVGGLLATLIEVATTGTLTDSALCDLMVACERLKSWADSRQLAAVDELTQRCSRLRGVGRRPDDVAPEVMAAAEIAPALSISPMAARYRVMLAQALADHPRTRAALASGLIDAAKARAILHAIDVLDGTAAATVEEKALRVAGRQTLSALRTFLRRAVLAADPAGAQARHEAAVDERGVWKEALDDGMARMEWVGPAEQVLATHDWLTSLAKVAQEADRVAGREVRTLDQARSDVIGDLGIQGLLGTLPFATPQLPTRHGRPPQIDVVVALSTLLGLDDEPAEIPGYGPITAEAARRLAADGVWRRLLTDPATGQLLERSATTYRVPQDIADLVLTRDRTCRGLGCRMPAARCDLDHTKEFPCGPTCPGNLCALCRSHHRVKTLTDTTYEPDGRGGHWWTMPSGRRYYRPPDPVLDHPGLIGQRGQRPPPDDDVPPF